MGAVIVIAGSADALAPLREIVAALPASSQASVFVVMHIGPHPSVLPAPLEYWGPLPAKFGKHGDAIVSGRIYVAPSDHHMPVDHNSIWLNHSAKVHDSRPAAHPLFLSAAEEFGDQVLGIVLSGGDGDGADGLRVIRERGGRALVQRPEEAVAPSIPHSAMMADHPDACLSAGDPGQASRGISRTALPRSIAAVSATGSASRVRFATCSTQLR